MPSKLKMAADLTEEDKETLEAILQSLQRDINCLADENRSTRKRSLEKIKKEVFNKKKNLSPAVFREMFESILKPLLKLFSDSSEKCRELACDIVSSFTSYVVDLSVFLPYIIPAVTQRLGQPEMVEPCEELRLQLVEMLCVIIRLSQKAMGIYVDDLTKILQRTLLDPFHEVRKASCTCTNLLAPAIPEQFHLQANSLVNPLLKSLSHQHSKVRQACIQTIGVVIQYSDGKNVDDVVSHLAQRTFDSTPSVRMSVVSVVGGWLLDLQDRYSYFHKLLPLLMTGLTDEIPDIQKKAQLLMTQVGSQYEKENEEELKDKKDFEEPLTNMNVSGAARPGLGSRVLVQRNLSKILPAALRDMTDWTTSTRVKASSLTYYLILYAEDNVTQHMELLLQGLYKATQDEEEQVVQQVDRCAEVAGRFVEPAVFCRMLLAHLRTAASSSATGCASCLRVFAGLLRGCDGSALVPHLQAICEALMAPEVCAADHQPCQRHLLAVVSAILTKAGHDCAACGFSVFFVLVNVLALQSRDSLYEEVQSSLQRLALVCDLTDVPTLYQQYSKEFLAKLKASHTSWTSGSAECQVFDALLAESGPVIGQLLDDVVPMFATCLDVSKDPELRLKMFSLLSRLLLKAPESVDSQHKFSGFSVTIVQSMIIPNCVWRAGRTAAAVRAAAVSCLWTLLQAGVLSADQLQLLLKDLLTQLTSCLDDHNKTTRLVTCKALQKLLILCKDNMDGDLLHTLYPELLKRMDDNADDVRVAVSRTFIAYFRAFPPDYDRDLYKLHLQAMFKGLLVHLDDPSSELQEAVLNALKEAAHVQPGLLREQVETVKHKHRVARFCDALLEHIRDLLAAS